MKIIDQYWEWEYKPENVLQTIEKIGRTCYKSESKITEDSAVKFVAMVIKNGHYSVIEHANASVRFITNRGVTHELVRHRLAAYSQESTRYVKYDGTMEFIRPIWIDASDISIDTIFTIEELSQLYKSHNTNFFIGGVEIKLSEVWTWLAACYYCEKQYDNLLSQGWRPEQAREVLPNSLKTEIVMTANLREWRHVFNLRCSKKTHPQMRELMMSCLKGFKKEIPVIFDDIYPDIK